MNWPACRNGMFFNDDRETTRFACSPCRILGQSGFTRATRISDYVAKAEEGEEEKDEEE